MKIPLSNPLLFTALAALALAGCASTPGSYNPGYGSQPYGNSGYGGNAANCHDCGTVTRIEMIQGSGNVPPATGAVIGGIVGAVAAREIAKDNTDSQRRRNVATAAGAAGGAAVGHAIQNRISTAGYNIHVRMDNGREIVVSQQDANGIHQGSPVRVYNGRVWPR